MNFQGYSVQDITYCDFPDGSRSISFYVTDYLYAEMAQNQGPLRVGDRCIVDHDFAAVDFIAEHVYQDSVTRRILIRGTIHSITLAAATSAYAHNMVAGDTIGYLHTYAIPPGIFPPGHVTQPTDPVRPRKRALT